MDVLAEGVETEPELTALAAMGCDQAQGFIFSRAVTAATIRATVKIADLRERSARASRAAETSFALAPGIERLRPN
jgi:EAL domain-containing protein (putative c-di-GMP-specific phosphodiesterase class I)